MSQQLSHLQVSTARFNPHHETVHVQFRATEAGYATLAVFDPYGAWLLSLGEVRIESGVNTLVWPGQGADGGPVPDGVYTLELFGFDLARRPGPAAPLRAQVEVLSSRSPSRGPDPLTVLLRQALPWGDYAPRAGALTPTT